jgi:flagellar hook-basal body complex protein FliE
LIFKRKKKKKKMSGLGDIKCFNCNRFGHYANECKQKRSPRFPFGRGRNRNLGYARSSAGGFQDYDERNEFIQMLMEKEKKKTLEEKEEKLKKQFSEIIKGEIDQLKRNLKVSEPKPEQEKNPTNEVLYEMKNMMKTQTLILNKLIKNRSLKEKRAGRNGGQKNEVNLRVMLMKRKIEKRWMKKTQCCRKNMMMIVTTMMKNRHMMSF